MRAKPDGKGDNSAAVAAQFGTSLKALRLYERLDMLKPARTRAGWRVYEKADLERLHAILSLKQLGLPLARIAELLKSGKTDLSVLLSMQEELLLRSRCETDHALTLIRIARARLKGKEELTAVDLAELVQKVSATVVRWTPELDELARRFYTPEQMSQVRSRELDPAEAAQISETWEAIMAELDIVAPSNDPSSDAALAIGRRMLEMFRRNSRGDKDMWKNSARFWKSAVNDPDIAGHFQMNMSHYDFVGRVLMEL